MPSKPTSKRMVAIDRRRRVAKLRLQGMSLEDMAVRLGWSLTTIFRDVQHLEEKWAKQAAVETYSHHVNVQRKKLQLLQQEAWAAFYRSMNKKGKIKEIRRKGSPTDPSGSGAGGTGLVVSIKSSQGDPRFMAIIQRAIEEENALLKIRQPDMGAMDADTNLSPLSIEVARDEAGESIFSDQETGVGDVIEGTAIVVDGGRDDDSSEEDGPGDIEAAG